MLKTQTRAFSGCMLWWGGDGGGRGRDWDGFNKKWIKNPNDISKKWTTYKDDIS